MNFAGVIKPLLKQLHIYAVGCYGHGGSLHDASRYNVKDIGDAIARWIADVSGLPHGETLQKFKRCVTERIRL